jgi:hypothetical protein
VAWRLLRVERPGQQDERPPVLRVWARTVAEWAMASPAKRLLAALALPETD